MKLLRIYPLPAIVWRVKIFLPLGVAKGAYGVFALPEYWLSLDFQNMQYFIPKIMFLTGIEVCFSSSLPRKKAL